MARAVSATQGELFAIQSQGISRSRRSNRHVSVRSDDPIHRCFPPCHISRQLSRGSHARDGVFVPGLPRGGLLSQVQHREPREVDLGQRNGSDRRRAERLERKFSMMRRVLIALAAGALMQVIGMQLVAADSSDARQWLMMVRTVNTHPTKEREFNAWYDDIDIPDVLKVTGYWRASRARTIQSPTSTATQTASPQEQGHYVALYNIESPAIDKTIIDMLMATWKMLSEGRDTPLLRVTERTYYHEYAP